MNYKEFFKKYMFWALIIALCSEVHFYPLNSFLRISLGIIILNTLILVRDDLNVTLLIIISGLTIFTERFITHWFLSTNIDVYPALIYYLAFALMFHFSKLQDYKDQLFRTVLTLAGIDIISNLIEAMIRGDLSSRTLSVVVMVGLIRSIAAYSVYIAWRRKELFIIKQEHQKRYSQLNTLVANVEAELFYLKKSAGDIEDVMGKCYGLYEQSSGEEREKLLDISKDIHEIKKDYLRVMSGFSDFVEKIKDLDHLAISDIFTIIKDNHQKVIKHSDYTIDLVFEQNTNPQLENYLSIFTILNNLIDNSIQAFEKDGTIRIIYKETGSSHQMMVMDNAIGMDEQIQRLIFNPGFTTKYSDDGKASTGIGLTHVKNTVNALGGTIEVDSIKDSGTRFTITLPKTTVRKKD